MGNSVCMEKIGARGGPPPGGWVPREIREMAMGVAGIGRGDRIVEIGANAAFSPGDGPQARQALSAVANQGIDRLLATLFLNRLQNPGRAVQEMRRVLVPGGRVVITDLNRHHDAVLKSDWGHQWLGFYCSDVRHWLSRAGFSSIIVSPVADQYCRFFSKDGRLRAKPGIFMATGIAV